MEMALSRTKRQGGEEFQRDCVRYFRKYTTTTRGLGKVKERERLCIEIKLEQSVARV